MHSITLEHVLVRLTGRKFFGFIHWPALYIGDTFTVSQSFGNRPESSEAWKIVVRGYLMSSASSFKRIGAMPPGPGDLSVQGEDTVRTTKKFCETPWIGISLPHNYAHFYVGYSAMKATTSGFFWNCKKSNVASATMPDSLSTFHDSL